jgi:murein DD-endopeptidase MepM/ murein hydrolase activator NlpD
MITPQMEATPPSDQQTYLALVKKEETNSPETPDDGTQADLVMRQDTTSTPPPGATTASKPAQRPPLGDETPPLDAVQPVTRLLPDSEVVYGPSTVDFDLAGYLKRAGGALGSHREYLSSTGWTSAAEIIERVALENSINPRLLVGLLEYQCGCVRGEDTRALDDGYALGVLDYHWKGLYGQLWWAANQLSAGYYGWKEGWLEPLTLPDGRSLAFKTETNPGTVALGVYFARLWGAQDQSARMGAQAWKVQNPDPFDQADYWEALNPQAGFIAIYQGMFGSAWERARQVEPLTPPGLQQPLLILPFEPGWLWSFTSGPHRAWEKEGSRAALDFAPASDQTGCLDNKAWVVAVGNGPVVRVSNGIVVQDLDDKTKSDSREQTGWAIFYMHIASRERVDLGTYLQTGERIGHPSCEGGPATGTHLHIARKHNGEWVAAAGPLPFVMDGWMVQADEKPYEGTLVKEGQTILANPYASFRTHIMRLQATPQPVQTAQPAIQFIFMGIPFIRRRSTSERRRCNRRPGGGWQMITLLVVLGMLISACAVPADMAAPAQVLVAPTDIATPETVVAEPTPFPTRPLYQPGELVDYTAQTGDTLPQLAERFNTSVAEILKANPDIPPGATTMPPGMLMKIPIYYLPLWGSPYRIFPDSLFVNGPAQIGFDTRGYVAGSQGWLKDYVEYAADANRSGAQIVDYIAQKFSVSPRLLLALLEYQAGALSQPQATPDLQEYPLGYRSWSHKGLYMQLNWAADRLNSGYYGYRTAHLLSLEHQDGRLERFDPWLNAASASLHYYFNILYPPAQYEQAISPDGLARTYRELFGDPWLNEQPHIPGSLVQPDFSLPFKAGSVWAYTGGPHTAWGKGEPYAALDFAPPAVAGGCIPTQEWATAIAPGLVVRSEVGEVVLDLDGDGDERTGWNVFYLHVGSEGRAQVGAQLERGDPVGHPSCEGGTSTGTHVHIARKYNGEWMPAEGTEGILAFNMDGWIPHNGKEPYEGTLTRNSLVVTACTCSNQGSFISADKR